MIDWKNVKTYMLIKSLNTLLVSGLVLISFIQISTETFTDHDKKTIDKNHFLNYNEFTYGHEILSQDIEKGLELG
jgi:hypothetical protein